ncbi:MAG: nitroreductase family protein [Planctomycetota bacterium]|jgi:nitroreductase
MDLREAILDRRSIRAFGKGPIPPDAVLAMKEAILWAPSAGHLQARRFWFVWNAEVRAALGRASYQKKLFTAAPLVVVGCADHRIMKHYRERGRDLYAPQDVAASVQNMLLTAHALGLGAVWVGAFREEEVARTLTLPPHLRPVAMVPVGVPGESPAPPSRLPAGRAFVDVP